MEYLIILLFQFAGFIQSQTVKHLNDRWENLKGSFAMPDSLKLQGKPILDQEVVIPGAALEESKIEIVKIELAKLGITPLALLPNRC